MSSALGREKEIYETLLSVCHHYCCVVSGDCRGFGSVSFETDRDCGLNSVYCRDEFNARNSRSNPQSSPGSTPVQARDLPNVSVTVEEYGDYQCPPCGVLYPEFKKIEAEYGNRIDFIFHNFPLTKNHKNALAAAQAAEAARLQDHFWQMHDLIYDNQNVWKDQQDPRPTFTKYARSLGLDLKRFARDLDGPEVQQRIAEDKQRADSLGIQGTPTVLVEGRQLKAEVTIPEGIRRAIDLLLARKAGK